MRISCLVADAGEAQTTFHALSGGLLASFFCNNFSIEKAVYKLELVLSYKITKVQTLVVIKL